MFSRTYSIHGSSAAGGTGTIIFYEIYAERSKAVRIYAISVNLKSNANFSALMCSPSMRNVAKFRPSALFVGTVGAASAPTS